MSEEDDRRQRGIRKMQEVSQLPAIEPQDAFMAINIDQVFGDLWHRPGLSDRERRLLSIAVVGSRGLEFETRIHIGAALKAGDLDPGEMLEVILHVAHYAGWPSGLELPESLRRARSRDPVAPREPGVIRELASRPVSSHTTSTRTQPTCAQPSI